MQSVRPSISVFSYEDFRAFLKDRQEELRVGNPKFSHRYIASKAGCSSSGWFSDILKGRMRLSPPYRIKLAGILRLGDRESEYFGWLVEYNQARTLDERNHSFRHMLGFREIKADVVGFDKLIYYNKWYFSAIRELLFLYDFHDNFAALGKKLRPPIKASEAKEAIQLLMKLDFIYKDAQGIMRPRPSTLKKDASFKSLHSANYLVETMRLGAESLDRIDAADRHVSGMTLSFSEAAFGKAKSEIETLRKKLVALMKEDPHPETVYQVNFQCFPLSRRKSP